MKKFIISGNEVLYYNEEEIEAETLEEAKEIYIKLLHDGSLHDGDTDFFFDRCDEIK